MQAHREDLARNGCTPYDPGRRQDYDRKNKESSEALEKAFDATIDKEIATMPASQ